MVECLKLLKPDAMTGHWEFTHGEARVKELVQALGCPFLAQNMHDNEWQDPVFDAYSMIERGGVKIAVIGQAFPFTALGIPRKLQLEFRHTRGRLAGNRHQGAPAGRRAGHPAVA